MANTLLSTLVPFVRIRKCPENLILQALRSACRQFLTDTEIWEEQYADIATVADQADYTLTAGYSNVVIKRVSELKYNDVIKHPNLWSFGIDNVLTMDPAPAIDDDVLSPKIIYVSTEACLEIIDWIIDRYGITIAKGAEYDLKSDPVSDEHPVPYYSAIGADKALDKYLDGVGIAKDDKFTKRRTGAVGVPIPEFYL